MPSDPVAAIMDLLLTKLRKNPHPDCPHFDEETQSRFATRMRILSDASLVWFLAQAAVNEIESFREGTTDDD